VWVGAQTNGCCARAPPQQLTAPPPCACPPFVCPRLLPACLPAVWSLGATLYALACGYSPNECERGPGGALRLAEPSHLRVLNPVSFPAPPAAPPFSPGFQRLVLDCLAPAPGDRSTAAAAGARARQLLAGYGRDDGAPGSGGGKAATASSAPTAVSRPGSPAV
jgi:serine/threonine protein kinase